MKSLTELQNLIINWAAEKDLLKSENAPKQRLKLIEEAGELASAYLKNSEELLKDSIGDCGVVLVILAEQLNQYLNLYDYDLEEDMNYGLDVELGEMIYEGCSGGVQYGFNWLVSLSIKLGYSFEECLNLAWDEIKDRTGKTINGSFVKNGE
jgi:NTP pyrophosphatase (non-canonical NTP hydrolase)